LKPGWHY